MFEKKLGEIRPNQFITTYGPGAIMDAVHDSLTVLDIEYWNANNIGQEIRDSRLASFMNVQREKRIFQWHPFPIRMCAPTIGVNDCLILERN